MLQRPANRSLWIETKQDGNRAQLECRIRNMGLPTQGGKTETYNRAFSPEAEPERNGQRSWPHEVEGSPQDNQGGWEGGLLLRKKGQGGGEPRESIKRAEPYHESGEGGSQDWAKKRRTEQRGGREGNRSEDTSYRGGVNRGRGG